MFKLFGFLSKNHFLGIDFGTSAIKVVELSYRDQHIFLENYGWLDTGFNLIADKTEQNFRASYEQRIKAYFQELVTRMQLKSTSANVAIPGYNGMITSIELPEMEQNDLEQAIQFEAHKHIPTSLDDISLRWDIVAKTGEGEGKNKRLQIMLVAAAKREVEKYEKLVREVGLEVSAIELETFSLVRALVGDDPNAFLIVDIGARATNLILVENGIIRVNRNVDSGGYDVTSTVSDSMNISRTRAEILKKEKDDLLNGREMSLVIPSLDLVSNEAMRMINSYREKKPDLRLESVILSGGSAKLKGIDQYFSKTIGVRAVVGNPWRRVYVDPALEPVVREKLGTSFSVALGLALMGADSFRRS
ncbi:type IV pilus assembly protein PilM [Patescibacteria group bacterium]|nr:MAG: type IV pilus assembly protein PilM [Patescibacteria group bacterium]